MALFNLPTLAEVQAARRATPKGTEPSRLQLKTEKARDEKKLEAAWKKAVWLRDKGRCRWCRRAVQRRIDMVPARAEIHHVCGRVVVAIRWDPRNGILLCAACHERITGKVAEKHVIESKHVYAVDDVQYINASKAVRFKRIV